MNTFKRTLAVVLTAVSLGGLASSQAFAWDNCEHDRGYSDYYSGSYYSSPRYFYEPSYDYRYGYEHRRHHDRD